MIDKDNQQTDFQLSRRQKWSRRPAARGHFTGRVGLPDSHGRDVGSGGLRR
jgi:hypothetical protein